MDTSHDKNSTIVRSRETDISEATADVALAAGETGHSAPVAEAAWLARDWRFRLLRTGMRTLSRLAPETAARMFDRAWFTPPRARVHPDAARWLARAERHEFRVHGEKVRAWSWGKGPAVLLVHGWGGHAGQMRVLGEALLDRGLRVVAFDAPAHGSSSPSRLGPRRVTLVEIADAVRIVAAGAGPLLGLVAHSGGCAATALALRDGWSGPSRMAFIAPFALPSQAVAAFGRAIGATATVTAHFSAMAQAHLARPWTDFDMTTLPAERAPSGSLVVHDLDDSEVPAAHGKALASTWPGARWMETTGLGHRRLLRDPDVAARIAEFIADGHHATASRPADARDELDRHFSQPAVIHGIR